MHLERTSGTLLYRSSPRALVHRQSLRDGAHTEIGSKCVIGRNAHSKRFKRSMIRTGFPVYSAVCLFIPKNTRHINASIEPFTDLSTVIDEYDESIEDIPGEWITAPAKLSSDRAWHLPIARFEPPSDLGKIASIIDEIVLRTNEHAMHVNNPREAFREWTWIMNDELEDNIDRGLMRSFSWMSWSTEEDSGMSDSSEDEPAVPLAMEGRGNPTIILFVQAPWILTKEDFKLFWTLESVRYILLPAPTLNFRKMPRANRFNEPMFNSAHRLWAKVRFYWVYGLLWFTMPQIWDECRRKHCHWFMLTNHDWWVFGVFSPGEKFPNYWDGSLTPHCIYRLVYCRRR